MAGELVLIVDNEADFRSALAEALRDRGFRVAEAANGLQALHEVAREPPAVVLLDIHMPVLDGPGFVDRLREYGASAPIIAMSAHPVSRQELAHLGAIAFLAKPFDLERLIDKLAGRSDDTRSACQARHGA